MAVVLDLQHFCDHQMYTVELYETNISVTVTAESSVAKRWLRETLNLFRYFYNMNRLVVGLGVQWTPGGRDPPPDTLQLCFGHRCLIFQLAYAEYVPMILRRFLRNPSITFVGFWNHSDRRKLMLSPHRIVMCRDPLDLRLYVKTEDGEGLAQAPVEQIVWECLEFQVQQSSEISMSNWGVEYLSDDQVEYACVDVHCAFLIGRNIGSWRYTG